MNERFFEMASRASKEAFPFGSMAWMEVFAELIVQDCTRIIANQAWESRASGANGDWTEYNALSRVAGQIKEHFGIEK
jgi:hypothetical protein